MASLAMFLVWRVIVIIVMTCVLLLAYRKYGDTPQHRRNILQFGGGLSIAVGLYFSSLFVLHQDSLVQDTRTDVRLPQRTMIVSGYVEVPVIANTVYETLDPRAKSFVSLPRSFNRQGGAQLTYQFWLYLDDVTPATVANKMILLRGDSKVYSWNDAKGVSNQGVAIACPSISFGSTYDKISICFNTLDSILNRFDTHSQDADPALDPDPRRNLLTLISKKWVLFTVVFEDNIPISEFENGLSLRFFVNDILYDYASYPGKTLRQNNGQLTLFPALDAGSAGINKARVADLSYYNYALEANDVKQVFDAGPPTYRSDVAGSSQNIGTPLYLSEYNKLDIYNS